MSARELIARWEAAEREGRYAGLLTDDFLAVGPVGFVLDGQAWVRRHADGLTVESLSIRVDSVRTSASGVAVVVGVQEQRASYGEHRADGRYRVTFVLTGVDADARVLGLHLSGPIPEGVP